MYCKIIIDNKIVDVCSSYLRWISSKKCTTYCDAASAHYVESSDGTTLYRNNGLAPLFDGEMEYIEAEIVEITEEEYNQLREELNKDNVESIPIEEEIIQETSEIPEPEPEVMSISAMRQKIIELTELIEKLTQKTESAAD